MTDRQKFTVTDRNRSIVFTGKLLGHSSSAGEKKNRWTEITIYITDAGQYVVAGVGQTTVKKGDMAWDKRLGQMVPAPEDEVPHFWSHVCDDADGAISIIHQKGSDGVRYMTRVARSALEAAILQDRALADAFLVENIS